MTTQRLSKLIEEKKHPVLDGAMATELEKLGVDTAHELWSAAALLNQPEAIAAVHRSYYESGADVATTNTYQANIAAFVARGLSEVHSADLIRTAVKIACEVRDDIEQDGTPKVVAGSVGPYGAYLADGSEYTGAYVLTDVEYRDFHRSRMQLLDEAGVDCFALETVPNGAEVAALLGLLADEFPDSEAWLSLSLADAEHLCDGTALADLAPLINDSQQIVAVGLNCTALENVEPALRTLSFLMNKPLLVYPNSGEVYDPETKTWSLRESAATFDSFIPAWLDAGAHLIGGCCRTAPSDIKTIVQTLKTV